MAESGMSNRGLQIPQFFDRISAEQALVAELSDVLLKAILSNGSAKLVVSGGSTPVEFFRLLSKAVLPWHLVTITLTDDRMVQADHADSNTLLVRKHLLQNNAVSARFLPLFSCETTAENAIARGNKIVAALGKTDAVILGMGSDGHTASLFPRARDLSLGLNPNLDQHCISISPSTALYDRLTLTLPALLNTAHLFLHFYGQEKLSVFTQAQATLQPELYPISAFLFQQVTPISIFYAD